MEYYRAMDRDRSVYSAFFLGHGLRLEVSYPDMDMQLEAAPEKQVDEFLMKQERTLWIFGRAFWCPPWQLPFFKDDFKAKRRKLAVRLGLFYHVFRPREIPTSLGVSLTSFSYMYVSSNELPVPGMHLERECSLILFETFWPMHRERVPSSQRVHCALFEGKGQYALSVDSALLQKMFVLPFFFPLRHVVKA